MADTRDSLVKSQINVRRSQRVVARIRVSLRRQEELQAEVGYTLVVNAHGALVSVPMQAEADEIFIVKNISSREEMGARVVSVSKAANGNEFAIEFAQPAPRFWHIDFPPADWKLPKD